MTVRRSGDAAFLSVSDQAQFKFDLFKYILNPFSEINKSSQNVMVELQS